MYLDMCFLLLCRARTICAAFFFFIKRKAIDEKQNKGDREEKERPESKPKARTIVGNAIRCTTQCKTGARQKQNKCNGEENNDPENQPKIRVVILELNICFFHKRTLLIMELGIIMPEKQLYKQIAAFYCVCSTILSIIRFSVM